MKIFTIAVLSFLMSFSLAGKVQISEEKIVQISKLIEKERQAYNIPSLIAGITDADSIIFLQNFLIYFNITPKLLISL